jgi:hypothetical protein
MRKLKPHPSADPIETAAWYLSYDEDRLRRNEREMNNWLKGEK